MANNSSKDPLTPEERKWLTEHSGKITLNKEPDWPSVISFNEKNNSSGPAISFSSLVEEKLGFRFKKTEPDLWFNVLKKIKNKELDVICEIVKNKHRSNYMLFTKPYIEIPSAIIVKNEVNENISFKNMKNLKIAVVEKGIIHDFFKDNYKEYDLYPQEDSRTCITKTASGEFDAAVVSLVAGNYVMEKEVITNLRIAGGKDFKFKVRFGIRNDWPILKNILDKGIDLISEKEKRRIYRNWIHSDTVNIYNIPLFWIIIFVMTGVAFLVLGLIMVWNQSLKKAVKEKTLSLNRTKNHLRTLLETIPDLVWLKKPDGIYLNCNKKFERLFGAKESDIRGKTDYDFVEKALADIYIKNDQAALKAGKSIVCEEVVFFAESGRKELQESIKTPVFDSEGNTVGVLGIGRDITERKRAEKELQEKKEELESILSNIKGVTFRCRLDEHWTMIYMSSHVEELTGYGAKDFINNTRYCFNSVIYEKDQDRVAESVHKAAEQKEPWEIEYRIRHKNGSIYWVFEKGSAVFDEKGNIESLDGFIININEKKIMEEHLNQSHKMEALGALAGGIAHDFNNILSGIMGFTELLQEDLKSLDSNGKLKERVDYIMKGSLRASELVSQILAFTRSDNDQLRFFNPSVITKEVIRLIESTLPSNIKVKKYLNSDLKIFGEPSKIHQVLMNLCTNAAYAMQENGGVLSLEMYKAKNLPLKYLEEKGFKSESYLCISVKDTGCGISEDILEKITEPFFTTKPEGEGTGMGLWVVKGIINTMNGFLDIQSKINSGTELKLFIPAFEKEGHKDENRKELKSLKGWGNICFVDDEESLTSLAYHSLTGYGYNVEVFNSSRQALKDFEKRNKYYDIIITDLSLPGLSGYDIAKRGKELRPDIPVILYTGFFNENIKNIDLNFFDEVLIKPILMSELALSIKKLIKNKEI
jgi:PAS domain S-box-containing protein